MCDFHGKIWARSPKIYARDSGLLHRLLGLRDEVDLLSHPKVGASWEGFVIEQLLAQDDVEDPWYWRTQQGAELDLYVRVGGRRVGVEIKRTEQPRMTPSIRRALEDLEVEQIVVLHAGDAEFPLAERVTAVPARLALSEGLASVL